MKPKIKRQWVDALRSGEYEQGARGTLKSESGYCCLGVLCDLAVKSGEIDDLIWRKGNPGSPDGLWAIEKINDSSTLVPIPAVVEWAGMDDENPVVKFGTARLSVAELNDGLDHAGIDRQPFSVLADIIESQL